jgi:hypothetical protein
LEGRQRAGEVSADDLHFLQNRGWVGARDSDALPDPQVYENYLLSPRNMRGANSPGTDLTDAAAGSGFARPVLDPRGRLAARFTAGVPQYAAYDDLHSPGMNYREVVVRSPELPSVAAGHFQNLPGNRMVQRGGVALPGDVPRVEPRVDDVLGWLRMQDYHPAWSGVSANARPYTWLDELQSDRFGDLRRAQRELSRFRAESSGPEGQRELARLQERHDRGVMGGELSPRLDAVDRAVSNLSPWTNTWDALLFRRALQEAYNRPDTQGLAWTSGLEQASRYPGHEASSYAPLYDQRLPRLARSEARRLQLPESDVGTMDAPQDRWRLSSRDTEDDPAFFSTRDAAQQFVNDEGLINYNLRPESVNVPFHYFNFTDDTRRALDRYGLPYFSAGGRV